ncbi:MAG TPA: cbb3-type cytochrome c oxidase subunit II [Rhodocyclaceae bacterium]|nr:cbb3-type cytochrome c oxidase subunit II [Rhodocyclaceae bacterium]
MNKLVLIAGGSTLVYACLALLMGVLPGIALSRTPPGPGVVPLTALQAEGREVYVANGCCYCHTQQVRPLPEDKVFGRPSAPGDFAYQTPELLGSERTGPDLTNVGVRQPSTVWQYIHLYNPRAVVPESIMPAFDWMFKVVDQASPGVTPVPLPKAYAPAHGVVVPDHQAEALVAYLLSLKQPALPGTSSNESGTAMPGMSSTARAGTSTAANGVGTAPDAAAAGSVSATSAYDAAKGKALFTANCAACHQANGEGLPGAFPSLKGNAAVNDADATMHIHAVLHGLQGANVGGVVYSSPMPAFGGTLSDADIANIIDYERGSWGNHGTPVTAEQVAVERAKGK